MYSCFLKPIMEVDYKSSEMNTTVSVTNIHYMTTVSLSSQYGQFSLYGNSFTSAEDEKASFFNFLDEKARYAVKSCDNSDWAVSECGDGSQRDSYVNNEELREVFAQLKSAALSTTNSEVSIITAATDTGSTEAQNDAAQWDTQQWKEYYESNRRQPTANVPVVESSSQKAGNEGMKNNRNKFFKNVQFNKEALNRIRSPTKLVQSDFNDADDEKSNELLALPVELTLAKVKERKFEKYTYTDHETWLFQNLTPEEIASYRERQKMKGRFAPSFISRRMTNKLHHRDIFKEIKPESFKKLDCKFEPHSTFPAFGEGKYTTTAVSKNYTFTPTQQVDINRGNYILDQRLKKLKSKKSTAKTSERPFQIRPNQSSSYINRMREYQRIHEENKKIAKKFHPNQIRTTSEVYQGASKTSFRLNSVSSKSSTSRFSSTMYTKSYDKKTVKQLAQSRNQYAPDKSPSKVPKKYRRPEWNDGHVDYKKTEVKPIQYKSIRKLPVVTLSNSGSSLATIASTSFLLKKSNGYTSTSSSSVSRKTNSCSALDNKKFSKDKHKLPDSKKKRDQTNEFVNENANINNNFHEESITRNSKGYTESVHTKSRIPVRKVDISSFDLNDEKFQVFQSWNKTLFGSKVTQPKRKNAAENKYEMKAEGIQKETKGERNTIRECREFVSNGDKNIERGGGDATDNVMTENAYDIMQNNELHEHQKDDEAFEKQMLELSSDTGIDREDNFDVSSDQDETLSSTSTISLEKDWESPQASRLSSPKRAFIEESPVQSASFGSLFENGFVNTLDIISERTESTESLEDNGETDGSSAADIRPKGYLSSQPRKVSSGIGTSDNSFGTSDNSSFESRGHRDSRDPVETFEDFNYDIVRLKVESQLNCLRGARKRVTNLPNFVNGARENGDL